MIRLHFEFEKDTKNFAKYREIGNPMNTLYLPKGSPNFITMRAETDEEASQS